MTGLLITTIKRYDSCSGRPIGKRAFHLCKTPITCFAQPNTASTTSGSRKAAPHRSHPRAPHTKQPIQTIPNPKKGKACQLPVCVPKQSTLRFVIHAHRAVTLGRLICFAGVRLISTLKAYTAHELARQCQLVSVDQHSYRGSALHVPVAEVAVIVGLECEVLVC